MAFTEGVIEKVFENQVNTQRGVSTRTDYVINGTRYSDWNPKAADQGMYVKVEFTSKQNGQYTNNTVKSITPMQSTSPVVQQQQQAVAKKVDDTQERIMAAQAMNLGLEFAMNFAGNTETKKKDVDFMFEFTKEMAGKFYHALKNKEHLQTLKDVAESVGEADEVFGDDLPY